MAVFADGSHLKAARILARMSRAELARASGLHPNSIKYWECDQGGSPPEGWAITQIAAALAAVGIETQADVIGGYRQAIVRKG